MKPRILLAILLTLALDAAAVEKWRAEKWTKSLEKTSALLKQGSYREALPILNKLNAEMLEALGPGEGTTYALVVPLIQTALAETGAGDEAAGLWHWHMAQTLFPKSAESDLTAFGEPGAVLKRNILSPSRLETCPGGGEAGKKVNTPPKLLRKVDPKYPRAAQIFGNDGKLVVSMKIRTDGTTGEPRIVNGVESPLAYAALEALRQWRFTPGQIDGTPVETNFCMTINYRLN